MNASFDRGSVPTEATSRAKRAQWLLGLVALVIAGLSTPAAASVTTYWSAGANCAGSNAAFFRAGGPALQMSLCVSTTTEGVCGATIQPQAAAVAEAGFFKVGDRLPGAALPDPTVAAIAYPIAIGHPASAPDFGGTVAAATAPGAAAGQLLATFTIVPQPTATGTSYVVGTSAASVVSTVSAGGNCFSGQATETPIAATFTLTKAAGTAPAATTAAASGTTASATTLNGTVTSNGVSTTVTFQYGPTPGYGSTVTAAQSPLAAGATGSAVSAAIAGLACGTTYHYRVVAENDAGSAYGGDAQVATSGCAAAPTLVTAASRKAHGGSTFDLPLAAGAATPTVEPRAGGTHTIVFTFDKPLSGGTASIGAGTATLGTVSVAGNELIVPLTGVANAQYVTVLASAVDAADGGTGGGGSVRVGFLAGDVGGNGTVTLSDLLVVNAVMAQSVTAANFLLDVNLSGTLSLADLLFVNANLAQGLPAP